ASRARGEGRQRRANQRHRYDAGALRKLRLQVRKLSVFVPGGRSGQLNFNDVWKCRRRQVQSIASCRSPRPDRWSLASAWTDLLSLMERRGVRTLTRFTT